jgi:hypothetical protein
VGASCFVGATRVAGEGAPHEAVDAGELLQRLAGLW